MANRYRIIRGNVMAYRAKHPNADAVALTSFVALIFVALLAGGIYDVSRGTDSRVVKATRDAHVADSQGLLDSSSKVAAGSSESVVEGSPAEQSVSVPLGPDGMLSDDPTGAISPQKPDPNTHFTDGNRDDDTVVVSPDSGTNDASNGAGNSTGSGTGTGSSSSSDGGAPGHPTSMVIHWSNHPGEYSAQIRARSNNVDLYGENGLVGVVLDSTWQPGSSEQALCNAAVDGSSGYGAGAPRSGWIVFQINCSSGNSYDVETKLDKAPAELISVWRRICSNIGESKCAVS